MLPRLPLWSRFAGRTRLAGRSAHLDTAMPPKIPAAWRWVRHKPADWRRAAFSAGRNPSASSDFALARVMNDAPHPLGSERHLNLRDAEFRKGVDHRIDDCGETACAAGFAAALGTQRIGFRG